MVVPACLGCIVDQKCCVNWNTSKLPLVALSCSSQIYFLAAGVQSPGELLIASTHDTMACNKICMVLCNENEEQTGSLLLARLVWIGGSITAPAPAPAAS